MPSYSRARKQSSSLSSWLGGRTEIRKFILSNVLPDLQDFVGVLNTGAPIYPPDTIVFAKARERMARLRTICENYGIQLITVLHPTRQDRAPFNALATAADAAGVPLLIPVAKMAYPNELYSDGFHLNAQGMEHFTRDLVSPLEETLLRRSNPTRKLPEWAAK